MSTSETDFGNIKPLPETKDSIAVAIKQTDGKASTPKVIAGGKGFAAQQILEIAFQNGIRVREDADLAELLSAVDVDSEIPLDAFAAVAEILTYVYQINNAMVPDPDNTQDLNETEIHKAQDLATFWAKPSDTDQ